MKSYKHSDAKAADKQHVPSRDPGRDFHSAKEKELRTAPEPKAHHKDDKRNK